MDDSRDLGFTLTEVVIVVALVGLIATAIAAVFTIVVRTNPSTEARVDDARSLLGITNYLPGDTSSTPIDPVVTLTEDYSLNERWDRRQNDPNTTPCSGYSEVDGVNVVTMEWDQGVTYKVHYRFATNDGSTWRLYRVYCAGTSNAEVIRLTAQLPEPDRTNPAMWTLPVSVGWKLADLQDPFGGPGLEDSIVGVELSLATIDGDTLRFDGSSNNPREFLASVSSGGGGGPGGPGPCAASFSAISPNPAKNQTNPVPNPGQDQDPAALRDAVTVTVTSSGTCTSLGIAYETTNGPQWRLIDEFGQVTIPAVGTEIWPDGSHALNLKDGQAEPTLDTASLVVN